MSHPAVVGSAFAWLLVLSACGSSGSSPAPSLANPASEYCVSVGGEVEIVSEPDGEIGYCNLPDGRRIEEWDLFRSAYQDD